MFCDIQSKTIYSSNTTDESKSTKSNNFKHIPNNLLVEKVTYKVIHLSHAVWNNFSNHIDTVADKRRFYWCKLHSIR